MLQSRQLGWTQRVILLVVGLVVICSCAELDPGIVKLALPQTAGAVTGTVINAGTPIAGATVSTVPATVSGPTDSAGHFTLMPVPPQTLTITVEPSGFLPASQLVTVLPGQTSTVTLTPAQSTSATINGLVTDGVNPIADAVVETVPPTGRVTTTQAGTFLKTGLTPGLYEVDASKPGFFTAKAFVTLTSGLVQKVTLAPTRRQDGVISGVVTDGVNPVGTTTEPVEITLFDGDRRDILLRPLFVTQPPPAPSFPLPLNFNYTFDAVPGGTAIVQARAAGFATGIKEVRVEPPLTANGEIILSRSGLTGAVAGTVFNLLGVPRPGITVTASTAPAGATTSTTADASGRFRFPALTPGLFDVTVTDPAFGSGTVRVTVAPAGTADGSLVLGR